MAILNRTLAAGLALALAACDNRPNCLVDAKDTAVVLDVEQDCSPGRYGCTNYDRLRMQRESDGTVCAMTSYGWKYKKGDRLRGPM